MNTKFICWGQSAEIDCNSSEVKYPAATPATKRRSAGAGAQFPFVYGLVVLFSVSACCVVLPWVWLSVRVAVTL